MYTPCGASYSLLGKNILTILKIFVNGEKLNILSKKEKSSFQRISLYISLLILTQVRHKVRVCWADVSI